MTNPRDRTTYIGASEVPAVLGLSPWSSPVDVYWRKVAPESVADTDSAAMATGRRLEPVIIGWCAEVLGVAIEAPVPTIVADDAPLGATPDGVVKASDPRAPVELVEAKYSSWPDGWGEPYTDQVPDHYYVQAQAQMAACALAGLRVARVWMPVLLMAGRRPDWRLYTIARHDEMCRLIIETCTAFWRAHVVPRVPPDPHAPPPESVLRALRRTPGSTVTLDAEASAIVDEYERACAAARAAEDAKAKARVRVLALLGLDAPAERGVLPDGRAITYVSQKSPPRVDYARLKTQYPEAWEACVSQGEHRVLRIVSSTSAQPSGDTP